MVTTNAGPPAEPFTRRAYAAYLDLALREAYAFQGFDVLGRPGGRPTGRFILLRHDIDYDLGAVAPISQLEAERGIRATYFFQRRCPFYSLDDPGAPEAVAAVLRDGHFLGLHFDATAIAADAQVVEEVERCADWLEATFGARVSAVSFHMPTHRPVKHLNLQGGRVNTYAPVFFEQIEYVSDSNQNWRGKDLARVLVEPRSEALQILTHPVWWRERFTPLLTILQELAARLHLDLERDILTPEQRLLLAARPRKECHA
jgi:hypothetical protein